MTTGAPPPPGGSCWDCSGTWAWCDVLFTHEGRVLLVSIVVLVWRGWWWWKAGVVVEGRRAGGGELGRVALASLRSASGCWPWFPMPKPGSSGL